MKYYSPVLRGRAGQTVLQIAVFRSTAAPSSIGPLSPGVLVTPLSHLFSESVLAGRSSKQKYFRGFWDTRGLRTDPGSIFRNRPEHKGGYPLCSGCAGGAKAWAPPVQGAGRESGFSCFGLAVP